MVVYRMWTEAVMTPITGVDSWWIYLLMVRRDEQRKAIGSSLVQLIQDKAAENDEPVGIDTTTALNVSNFAP